MKKVFLIVLLALFVAAPVFALEDFQYDKSKVFIGVELAQEDKDIDDAILADIQIGDFVGVGLTTTLKDFTVTTELLKVGYEINESVKPYLLVGAMQLEMKQQLNGSAQLGPFSGGTTLMETNMDGDANIAYGIGIGGDVAQYKGIVLSYDARYLNASVDNQGNNLSILPEFTDIKLNNDVDVDYNELDLALIASKTFDLTETNEEGEKVKKLKIIESLTPSIGYRYSYTTVNVENKTKLGCISMESETNYRSHNHDLLLGLGAQVNENVSVKIAAIVGDNTGGMISAGYKF